MKDVLTKPDCEALVVADTDVLCFDSVDFCYGKFLRTDNLVSSRPGNLGVIFLRPGEETVSWINGALDTYINLIDCFVPHQHDEAVFLIYGYFKGRLGALTPYCVCMPNFDPIIIEPTFVRLKSFSFKPPLMHLVDSPHPPDRVDPKGPLQVLCLKYYNAVDEKWLCPEKLEKLWDGNSTGVVAEDRVRKVDCPHPGVLS